MSTGTIFHGRRGLKAAERRHLLARWVWYVGSALGILIVLLGMLAWAVIGEDSGLGFLFVLFTGAALPAIRWLVIQARPFGRDLRENRVEAIVGGVGSMAIEPGLVPLYLGEYVFYVDSELLISKKKGAPILVEYLPNTGMAIAIDGQSNFTSEPSRKPLLPGSRTPRALS